MRINFYFLIALFLLFASCKNDESARLEANARDTQKKDQIFADISKAWNLKAPALSPNVQNKLKDWAEWRLFLSELNQKPKSSIGAFQQKARALSRKVTDLANGMPPAFDKPEVLSRIMALSTKIKSLELFINLSNINEDKVLKLIPEINAELASLEAQMEEIVKKSEIRLEDGEAEMLRSIARDSLGRIQAPQTPPSDLQAPGSGRRQGAVISTPDPK
ncbi:MAG TPA: hypothetical protein VFR70_01050 [Flavobacterium sp.]|nr:hypothetical protein [Flavobacterium sp.]